jgi:ribose/xylose/arabinose/galactoside ABC-type transport system permease subunit
MNDRIISGINGIRVSMGILMVTSTLVALYFKEGTFEQHLFIGFILMSGLVFSVANGFLVGYNRNS